MAATPFAMQPERPGRRHCLVLIAGAYTLVGLAQGAAIPLVREVLPSAVCADGSPAWYHIATNASSSDYLFYLRGGADSCAHDPALCPGPDSIPNFFSEHDELEGRGLLSGDLSENPLYSTFNRVLIPYCSMDMFLLDTQSADGELQFRGRSILEETLSEMLGPVSQDATVVLAGSTAGGVGAFNAARWVLDTFDQVAELSVVVDSAFLFDVPGYLTPFLEYLQEHPSAAYSDHCSEEFNGGPCCMQFACMKMNGYYPAPVSESDLFLTPVAEGAGRMRGTLALTSSHHPLEARQIVGELGVTEGYGGLTGLTALGGGNLNLQVTDSSLGHLAALYPSALSVFSTGCVEDKLLVIGEAELSTCLSGSPPSSTYLPGYATNEEASCSCLYGEGGEATARTCGGSWDDADSGVRVGLEWSVAQTSNQWKTVQIDGVSVRSAMEQWWSGRGDASKQVYLVDDCDGLGCNPSCPSELLLPGDRDESNSAAVWAIVLGTFASAALVLVGGCLAGLWSCLRLKEVKEMVAQNKIPTSSSFETASISRHPSSSGAGGGTGVEASETSGRPVLEWEGVSHWPELPQGEEGKGWCNRSDLSGGSEVSPEKRLLYSVGGSIPEGALCAITGPGNSSGKSTLLHLLSGRPSFSSTGPGQREGTVLFEGRPVADDTASFVRKSGYIRQGHTGFVGGLTVFDNLVFSAMLRTPGSLEKQTSRVQSVIQEARLDSSRGVKGSDLSEGKKRLLSLAVELLSDRRVLLLDQPLLGLDSAESLELMEVLKRLASTKIAVVMAVEYPRPEIWRFFSHSILLKSGKSVYCGPADQALEEVARFLPQPEAAAAAAGGVNPEKEQVAKARQQRLRAPSAAGTDAMSSDVASTVTASMMSGSAIGSAHTSMRFSGALLRGSEAASEDGDGIDARSTWSYSNHGRSSSVSGGGGGGGGAGKGADPRTPSREPPARSSRARKGLSMAHSTASTISAGAYYASIPADGGGGTEAASSTTTEGPTAGLGATPKRRGSLSRGGSRAASSTTTETATVALDATPKRQGSLSRVGSDPFATSFSEFSSGGSHRDAAAAIASGNMLAASAHGLGLGGGGGLSAGTTSGASDGDEGRISAAVTAGVGGGRGGSAEALLSSAALMRRSDPDQIFEILAGLTSEGLDEMARAARESRGASGGALRLLPSRANRGQASDAGHGPFSKVEGKHPSPTAANGLLGIPSAMMAGGDLEAAVRRAAGIDGAAVGTGAAAGGRQESRRQQQASEVEEGRKRAAIKVAAAVGASDNDNNNNDNNNAWAVAAILVARSYKSGYARRLARHFLLLVAAVLVAALAFQAAEVDRSVVALPTLALSVLVALVLPVLIVYRPLVTSANRREWASLAAAEVADGVYPPLCSTARLLFEQLAVAVVVSFSVVGIMHAVLWRRIISELPAPGFEVYLQLSCMATLLAWVMISLFNVLSVAVSSTGTGTGRTAVAVDACLRVVWVFFSGVFLLTSALPGLLRAVTYTSPHYWSTSFMLRVLLDGLDLTEDCDYASTILCATSYGDLAATRLGLRSRTPGFSAVVMAALALAGLLLLAIAVKISGRHPGKGDVSPGAGLARETQFCTSAGYTASSGLGGGGEAPVGSDDSAAGSVACSPKGIGGDGGGVGVGVHSKERTPGRGGIGIIRPKDTTPGRGGTPENSSSAAGKTPSRARRVLDTPGRARRVQSARSASGIFGRGNKVTRTFAFMLEQEEKQRSASLRSTADIIEEARRQRSSASSAAAQSMPSAHARTASGSSLFDRRLKWPTFLTPGRTRGRKAVSDEFPQSSVNDSSPPPSFKTFSPQVPEAAQFSDDENSPPPLTPGKSYAKVTAAALARGSETSKSPLKFARGLGGWWSETSDGAFEGRSSFPRAARGGADRLESGGEGQAGSKDGGGGGGGVKQAETAAKPMTSIESTVKTKISPSPGGKRAAGAGVEPLPPKRVTSSAAVRAPASSSMELPRPLSMKTHRPLSGAKITAALAAGAASAQAKAHAEAALAAEAAEEALAAEAAAAAAAAPSAETAAQSAPLLPETPLVGATAVKEALPEAAAVAVALPQEEVPIPPVAVTETGAEEGVAVPPPPYASAVSMPNPRLSSPSTVQMIEEALGGVGDSGGTDVLFPRRRGARVRPPHGQERPAARPPTATSQEAGSAQQSSEHRKTREEVPLPAQPGRPTGDPVHRLPSKDERWSETETGARKDAGGQEEEKPAAAEEAIGLSPGHRSFAVLFPTSPEEEDEEDEEDEVGPEEVGEEVVEAPRFHRGFEVLFPESGPLHSVPEQCQLIMSPPADEEEQEGGEELRGRDLQQLTPGRQPSAQPPVELSRKPLPSVRNTSATASSGSTAETQRSFFPGAAQSSSAGLSMSGSGAGGYSWGAEAPSVLSPMSLQEEDERDSEDGEADSGGSVESSGISSGSSSSNGGGSKPGALAVAVRRAKMASSKKVCYSPGYGME